MHDIEIAIAAVMVLGVGALWLADRLRVPAILLLLASGVVAGPVSGVVEPAELLGDTLFPAVSLAVAILLFEGGLQLRWDALEQRSVLIRLVTVGVVLTWLIGWGTASLVFDVPTAQAALLGAILTVSGPTVVLPLLRQVGVRQPLDGILRWEGIVVDPIGATLAVVVFEVASQPDAGFADALAAVGVTAVVGCVTGGAAAAVLVVAISRGLVADRLHVPVALAVLVAAWAASNAVRTESGLFAATVLGVLLANQRRAPVAHIAQFSDALGLILLGPLFIVLGATVDLDAVGTWIGPALAVSVVLILVARPLAAIVSTAGTNLEANERSFLAAMAPRGIVAASVSALFGLQLEAAGLDGEFLAPATFVVVVVTVVTYGLTARPLAARLRLVKPQPRGIVIVGVPPWALHLAAQTEALGLATLFVTGDQTERDRASDQGHLVYNGPLTPEDLAAATDAMGGATVLAASDREEANALALEWLAEHLGRPRLVHLPTAAAVDDHRNAKGTAMSAWGRELEGLVDQDDLRDRLERGWRFTTTTVGHREPDDIALVLSPAEGSPEIVTTDTDLDRHSDVAVVVLRAPA